jgi:sirohydrochlorin ferrochelatase
VGTPLPGDDLDPTKVYVTTNREYARIYANGYPLGALYVVEPIGELTASPDPVPSWGCSAATVIGVYDACVRLTAAQVRRAVGRYL